MTFLYPGLIKKITEVAEGDTEFQAELTVAIYLGLKELKKVYSEGYLERNMDKIQKIRHKHRPTMTLFDFQFIVHSLQEGKEMLELRGFDEGFDQHFNQLMLHLEAAILEVEELTKGN
jgi:hypothetical protein